MIMNTPVQLPSEVLQALENGKSRHAVEILQQQQKIEFKEAKALVITYLEQNPDFFARYRSVAVKRMALKLGMFICFLVVIWSLI